MYSSLFCMSFTFSATTSNPEIPIILYYICYILSNCIILNSLFRKRSAGHGSTRDEGQRWIRPVLILDPLHSTPIDPFMCADLPKDTRNNHDRHWRDNVDFPVCSLVMCCPYKLCVLTLIDSQAHTHTQFPSNAWMYHTWLPTQPRDAEFLSLFVS